MFYRYLAVVVLLFGWLNLVNSSQNSLQLKNKQKTYGDDCKIDEVDKYMSGPIVSLAKAVDSGIKGEVNVGAIVDVAYTVKDLSVKAMSAIPMIGPFIEAAGGLITAPDGTKACLSQISEKLDKGFAETKELISKSGEEVKKKIDQAKEEIKKEIQKTKYEIEKAREDIAKAKDDITDEIRKMKEELQRDIQKLGEKTDYELKINRITTAFGKYEALAETISLISRQIEQVLNPKTFDDDIFNQLKKKCKDIDIGPQSFANRFLYLTKGACSRKKRSVDVKQIKSLLKNKTKTSGNSKYSGTPGYECILTLIRDTFFDNVNIRISYLNTFFIDAAYISDITTYCGGIALGDKVNDTHELDTFYGPVNQSIFESLIFVEKIIMTKEIDLIERIKTNVTNGLPEIQNSITKKSSNPNFWIEGTSINKDGEDEKIGKLEKLIQEDSWKLNRNRNPHLVGGLGSMIFADGTSNYHIFSCPRSQCFFLRDNMGMYLMYSTVYDIPSVNDYINLEYSSNRFLFDLGEVAAKVNKSSSNLTAIAEEFVKLDPFRNTRNSFFAAAMFYTNKTELKSGYFVVSKQRHLHYTIQTEAGLFTFIAAGNYAETWEVIEPNIVYLS
jgi:ElaB/YqjD/DUF883 family membrane-anchored ribosome-binding protein